MATASSPASNSKKPKPKTAHFTIAAALLEELGERLVSRPEVALAELIKNAYDADSPTCELTLSPTEIMVTDEGHGMTERQFLDNWMVISSQDKGDRRFSPRYNRSMAGSKGIGRFSARYLGAKLQLTSVAAIPGDKHSRLKVAFDWDQIKLRDNIGEIIINYTVEKINTDIPVGTTLRITKLRKEATQISTSKVKSDILRLTNPAAGLESPPKSWNDQTPKASEKDPGFIVRFNEDEETSDGEGLSPNVAAEILSAFVGRVRINVSRNGKLNYRVYWNRSDEPLEKGSFRLQDIADPYTVEKLTTPTLKEKDSRGFPAELKDTDYLPLANLLHSPVFIDVRFFPRRKGTFSNLSVNGKKAQSWISKNASLAIVDNHFVMPAYADRESDWLGIDASKARNERSWQSVLTPALFPMSAAAKADAARNPMLALPRGSQVVGRIHIATQKRPPDAEESSSWLQPNMDRESLRSNDAFNLLWHISRFSIELIAHFDREQRLAEEEKEQERQEKEAHEALQATIADVKATNAIAPEHQKRIVSHLTQIKTRLEDAQRDLAPEFRTPG